MIKKTLKKKKEIRELLNNPFHTCIFCNTPISYNITKRPYCLNCGFKYWGDLKILKYILITMFKVKRVKN